MNFKKIGRVFTSKFVVTGPLSYKKKIIYQAAIWKVENQCYRESKVKKTLQACPQNRAPPTGCHIHGWGNKEYSDIIRKQSCFKVCQHTTQVKTAINGLHSHVWYISNEETEQMYEHMSTIPLKSMYYIKAGHHKYYNLHLVASILFNNILGMLQKQTFHSINNNMYNKYNKYT
jgi:hypothetical protein